MYLELYQYLLIANGLDILTGISKALATGTLSSKKLKTGAMSKTAIWLVVFVSLVAQNYLAVDVTSYVIGYYLIMELVSIVENVSDYIPIPDKLKNLLAQNQTAKKSEAKKETVKHVNIITEDDNDNIMNRL